MVRRALPRKDLKTGAAKTGLTWSFQLSFPPNPPKKKKKKNLFPKKKKFFFFFHYTIMNLIAPMDSGTYFFFSIFSNRRHIKRN